MTGVREPVERFGVRADPAHAEGPLGYDGSFYRDLSATLPVAAVPERFAITSLDGATEVSTAFLQPFVCKDAGLLGSGPVTETRDLWIETDGKLWTTGDFDHPFTSRCESPSMGSGVATGFTSPGYCSDPDRAGTQVALSDSTQWVPDRCRAAYSNYGDGVLSVVLTFSEAGQAGGGGTTATLTLSHCIAAGEAYPLTVTLPGPFSPPCRFDAVTLSIGTAGSEATVASAGSWEITAATLERGGRIAGSVAAQFTVPGGGKIDASGVFDLPHDMIRVAASP
jgi:hypothetical protein